MFGTLLAALLVAQQPPAQTQAPQPYWSQGLTRLPPGELKVVVAAPVYQPDGATNAETATMTGAGPNVVHLFGRRSICDVAVTGAAPPSDAKFGWRLTAQTLSATDALVVVSVDWQRLWDRGQKIGNGPSGTVQLSLHPGDRIPLDLILNPLATDACRAVSLGLEVRLARTAPDSRTPDSSLLPLGATEGGAAVLDADLWLVQRLPSGIEQAHHQSVRVPAQGASFSFPSVTVPTARGDVTVEVGGSFKRYKAPAGNEYLLVSMTRGLAGAKMPAGGTSGGTATVIPLPGPTEVLSIEMPAPGGGGGTATGGPRGRTGGGGAGGGAVGAGMRGQGGPRSAGPPPDPAAGAGQTATGPAGGGARGGRGVGTEALAAALSGLLEGNTFSLRLRVTALPGS